MIQLDIPMPKGCYYCPCFVFEDDWCQASDKEVIMFLKDVYENRKRQKENRPDWCPLIDVKDS